MIENGFLRENEVFYLKEFIRNFNVEFSIAHSSTAKYINPNNKDSKNVKPSSKNNSLTTKMESKKTKKSLKILK
ncbi:MAG: hypothetical protein K2P17_02040 [Helicobacteraceae bacterium]|nr:hypothetical protein [Helicobacteraceae bacterium]